MADGDRIWRNAHLVTLNPGLADLGLVGDGAIAVRGERLIYVGPEAGLPGEIAAAPRASIAAGAGSRRV